MYQRGGHCVCKGEARASCAYDSPAASTSPAETYSAAGIARTAMYRASKLKYGSSAFSQRLSEAAKFDIVGDHGRSWEVKGLAFSQRSSEAAKLAAVERSRRRPCGESERSRKSKSLACGPRRSESIRESQVLGLRSDAISGNQKRSEANSGNQRRSTARGDQMQSEAIRCNQRRSDAI